MTSKYIAVIDDCVSPQYQDFIERHLFDQNTPWFFTDDITGAENETCNTKDQRKIFGFYHMALQGDGSSSFLLPVLEPLLLEATSKAGITVSNLFRIRIGLNLQDGNKDPNKAHIDFPEPHMVGLYYAHQTDGETVFFSDIEAKTEIKRVAPKKGRIVLFDGQIPHSSSSPVNYGHRVAVNFNFLPVDYPKPF